MEQKEKEQRTKYLINNKKEEPIEYRVGFSNFLNCRIDLSLKPFIPESETRYWVKRAIRGIQKAVPTGRQANQKIVCLDIFAGSGCIGIAILKHIKNARVDFAEIDKNFIKQIKINLKLNKIDSKRYKVIQSDVFESPHLKFKCGDKYDYIFANPPYIALKNKHLVQNSVYDFEPHKALFGGQDGLLYIRKFLEQARKHLNPNGEIWMEFDYLQKRGLEDLLKELNYKNYKICKDQFQTWRYIKIFGKI